MAANEVPFPPLECNGARRGRLAGRGIVAGLRERSAHHHHNHDNHDHNHSTHHHVPTLTCITPGDGNSYTAYFGYSNAGSAVSYPDGSSNEIEPPKYDGGQPTSFISGIVTNSFRVSVNNGSVTWSVSGRSVTASPDSTTCSGSSLPVDPLGLSLVIAIALGVVFGVVVIRRTARRKGTL